MGIFSKKRTEEIIAAVPPPTQVMETNSNKFRVNKEVQQQIDPREEVIKSYAEKYGDLFSPEDFVGGEAGRANFCSEACKLLFAIQNEVRELKEEIKNLK